MNPQEQAAQLIERYLQEVASHLPKKLRDDVRNELHTLLLDGLNERALAAKRPPDEDLAVELLREFGEPEEVAWRYLPSGQYLIGPKLYPYFLFWARMILWFVGGILAFWFVVGLVSTPSERLPEFLRPLTFGNLLGEFIELAFINLGLLVLVFAVIEWFTRREEGSGESEEGKEPEWNPRDLPKIEDPDRVSPGGLVAKIYCIIAFFLVLNFFPQYFGIIFFANEQVYSISFLQLGLKIPIQLLNAWWVLALALNVWLLREGRWTRESRWAEFGIGVFGLGILFLTLAGSSLGQLDAGWLARGEWKEPRELLEGARRGLPWLGRTVQVILTSILVIAVVESGVRLYRLFTRYRTAE